jgi:glycosyltransferase involved in cell wall biosynthesis
MTAVRPLRIALIAPPFLPVPPPAYAGTERIIAELAAGLHRRGHRVTAYVSGDSDLPCEIVPVVPRALWRVGYRGDATGYISLAVAAAWEDAARYDIVHSHVETAAFLMARHCDTPVVTTLHRRLDLDGVTELIDRFDDVPLIAISENQRRWNRDANWVATIHHGLDFSETPTGRSPGDYLLCVGRISPEKGVAEAVEVATRTGLRLVMAAKVYTSEEQALFEAVVRPAIEAGIVDWRGEVGTAVRDELMAGALATLMLGGWPEPFGLVAIESMATGTPVIARRAGACTETIEHGVTGFLVDDVDEAVHAVPRVVSLDRGHISASARVGFSADRMVTQYEHAYEALLAARPTTEVAARSHVRRGRRDARRATIADLSARGVAPRTTSTRRLPATAEQTIAEA